MGRLTKTGVSCEAGGAGGGGAGNVASVVAGAGIDVDATDPDNPIVAVGTGEVTLAMMANLAQDKFIVRTTASTGVPETATCTAAARTVLDDASVSAMVDTLGGASATGTGGLVRATSPTLVTPALGTPASGTLTNCTGGSADKAAVPLSSKSAAYTTVLGDANTTILHPSSDNNARTFTIDSNANVAYATGTMITFVNRVNTVTIAITSDTMYLAGAGTTGSRTLAAHGVATAIKTGSTEWVISGTGLT